MIKLRIIALLALVTVLTLGAIPTSAAPAVNPKDYLPLKVGNSWTYAVTISEGAEAYAVVCEQQEGDTGDPQCADAFTELTAGEGTLTLEVRKVSTTKSGLIVVQMEVVTDDLGLYTGADEVDWIVTKDWHIAQQFVFYTPGADGAPTPQNALTENDTLYTVTGLFYWLPGKYNTNLTESQQLDSEQSKDGKSINVVRCSKGALHIDEGLSFTKGIGLALLVQTPDEGDTVTMRWTLTDYTVK